MVRETVRWNSLPWLCLYQFLNQIKMMYTDSLSKKLISCFIFELFLKILFLIYAPHSLQ